MESNLSLPKSKLEGSVGLFLGWGRGADNGDEEWDARKKATIQEIVESGQRQFYVPPAVEGERVPYEWSFLRPTVDLTLSQGQSALAMPDDFGGFEGLITLSAASSTVPYAIELTGEGVIRQLFAESPDMTGRPMRAALVPLKGLHLTKGQRFDLNIFPTADQDYALTFQYYLLPNAIDGTRPYVYGGAAHAETVLESCLAIAEQRQDDAMGVHTAKWMERLIASIGQDRKNKPQKLGYNRDCSDGQAISRANLHGVVPISVGGVTY